MNPTAGLREVRTEIATNHSSPPMRLSFRFFSTLFYAVYVHSRLVATTAVGMYTQLLLTDAVRVRVRSC